MLDQSLTYYFDTASSNNSNYFDFVEKKIEEQAPDLAEESTDAQTQGKDAFVVQVMDEKTSRELKRRYFKTD